MVFIIGPLDGSIAPIGIFANLGYSPAIEGRNEQEVAMMFGGGKVGGIGENSDPFVTTGQDG